jgi:tetratricopeptide (TPR) repeat protein
MGHVIHTFHPKAELLPSQSQRSGLYRSVLYGKEALLLLDDAAGPDQVKPLVPPESCVLLVTSRHRFRLPDMHALNLNVLAEDEARDLLCAIARDIGHRHGEGIQLSNLGLAYRDLGQMEKAIDCYEQALVIARDIGDRHGEAIQCWNLGLLYEESDPARAAELTSVLVSYEREIGHPDAQTHAEQVARIRTRVGGVEPLTH